MSLTLSLFLVIAGLQNYLDMTPKIIPARVCDSSPMTIIKDQELDLSLAVVTLDGRLTFLADHITATTIPLYWTHNEISFRADELYGIDYRDGIPHLRKIFESPGEYKFIFSDNFYTERENAIWITRTVTYLGQDHPDCPKFPLQNPE
jgi:hypothetical protein